MLWVSKIWKFRKFQTFQDCIGYDSADMRWYVWIVHFFCNCMSRFDLQLTIQKRKIRIVYNVYYPHNILYTDTDIDTMM